MRNTGSSRRRLLGVVLTALAVTAFALAAPAALGGSAVWVSTAGDSMQPQIHAGDLIIARPAADYQVGDIVAYRSQTLGGTVVLHRVVAESTRGLVTKGDHNNWLDHDRPHPSQVLGAMWLHIPGAGRMLNTLSDPFVIASLAGVLLTAGGLLAARRSRRRRYRRAQARNSMPRPGSAFAPRDWAAGTAVAALVLAFIAFGQPTTRHAGDQVALTHSATLGYSADAGDSQVYADGRVRTGDPVFLAITPVLDLHVRYRLTPAGEVSGTIRTVARVAANNGWERAVDVGPPTRFDGSRAEHETAIDLTAIRRTVQLAEDRAGVTFGGSTLEITHEIHVSGQVAGEAVDTTYRPKLTFALDSVQAVLQGGSAGSGTDDVTVSQNEDVAVAGTTDATVRVLSWQLPVRFLRILAAALGVLSLVLFAMAMQRRRGSGSSAHLFGRRLVHATSFDPAGRPVVDVATPTALLRAATLHDTVVVHTVATTDQAYFVTADGTVYRYADDTYLAAHLAGPGDAHGGNADADGRPTAPLEGVSR